MNFVRQKQMMNYGHYSWFLTSICIGTWWYWWTWWLRGIVDFLDCKNRFLLVARSYNCESGLELENVPNNVFSVCTYAFIIVFWLYITL